MTIVDRKLTSPAGRFTRNAETSFTLPAHYYFDEAIYKRELEAIFFSNWNYAGHVSQLAEPGSYVTTQVGNQNILVIRGQDTELRAFHNVCSHRAHELLKGCGKAKLITCPYHAWTYHTDGKLRSAVGQKKVANFEAKEFALKPVRVEVLAGFVYVNLDPDAASLKSQSEGLEGELRKFCPEIEDLKLAKRISYTLKANWKNVVDNYLECYHCTPAHPAFVDLVDIKNYRTITHKIYSSHISPPGRADNTAYCLIPGQEGNFAGFWVWPNMTFNSFPGCPNIGILHIMPTGPETTLEHFDFFFGEDVPEATIRDAIDYLDKTLQPEDIGLVESVQRGLHSKAYTQGRFIVDKERTFISEHGLHHFHSLVLDALGDLPE
ncbi:MAG: aromatic ring-hydroxylating dioxygenase subunit alpha [Hyphomicrobiaceae bacterium]